MAAAVAALLALTATARAAAPTTREGRVRGVVLAPGMGGAVAGAEVAVVGGPRCSTNRYGGFELTLPAGDVVLLVTTPGGAASPAPAVPVVAGTTTEVIVTLPADGGPPTVAIESARPEDAARAAGEGPSDAATTDAPPGRLVGEVIDAERGRAVASARVYVRGSGVDAVSDAAGRFALELPPGEHDITLVHPRYAAKTVRGLVVPAGGEVATRVTLDPASIELAGFTVSAPRLVGSTLAALGERRASAAVAEIIGAEQMRRAGDSDAAGALKRATGVTVQDGRFVYIRGLGPRYTGTLLNGSELPSPEPDRRVVPLDMFPAGLLESVSIQKTYSAELPGGFGGGMVKIRTRPFPGELEASVSLSGSARTRTTFLEGPMSAGGAWDWLGVDGGARALPDSVQAASSRAPLLETDMFSSNGYTAAELERFGEAMQPRGGWAAKRRVVPPGVGLGGDLGDSVDFDGGRFGFLAALGYDSDWQHERYNEKFCDRSGCNASYDFEQLEMRVTTSGILSLGLDLGDAHELRWTTFVNHIGSDEVRGYEGYNDDVQTDVRVDRQRFVEQTLLFDQLRGKHVLAGVAPAGDAVLEWRYALSTAWRSEPDRRQTRYDYDPGLDAWLLADRPDGNSRVSSNLSDVAHDVGVDTSWPLVAGEDGEEDALAITLKAGAAFAYKDREVDTRRYRMSHKGALATDAAILARSPDAIFVPENIGVDGFQLAEVTLPTDNYTGTQTVVGVYALGELALGERLTVQAGARVEASSQRLSTFEPFNPDGAPLGADLSTLDVLPSLNASWQVAEGHALRLGVARTVTRPDFRELSPATFNDVTGGKQSFGNPDLDRTLITHVDARWDWYPSDGELISVGAFWKRFEDPIEQVLIPSAQLSQSWDNVPEANNLGLELEVRLGLGFLGDVFEDLELAGNFAWIHSRVSLAGLDTIQTSKDRALEGQAPYVVNLELAYDDEESGTSAALLYNTTGAYITEVGAQGRGEEVQAPRHVIDLVFGQKLGEGWSFKVKARNLLDSPSVRRIPDWEGGGLDVKRVSLGRELSVGISKKW